MALVSMIVVPDFTDLNWTGLAMLVATTGSEDKPFKINGAITTVSFHHSLPSVSE